MKLDQARVPEHLMERAWENNPDGGGAAWIESEGDENFVHFEKGLDYDDLLKLNKDLPFPYVLHMRVSTAGGISDALCHPFPIEDEASTRISGKAKRVLFHNGTIAKWRKALRDYICNRNLSVLPGGDLSDTRAAAYMAYHMQEYGEDFLPILSDDNRFLVMDADTNPHTRIWGDWHSPWYYANEEDAPASANIRRNGKLFESGALFSNTYWNRKTYGSHRTTGKTC